MTGFKLGIAVLAAWVLLGLAGHDPWKADEAYTFGLVWHILETGDWIVPTLGGEPFMEKPPVFFITAAAMAKLFGWLLPVHDAARLAAGLYTGLALLFAGLAARRLYGPGAGIAAALLLAACLGYVHHAHQLITDTALVAGIALAFLGLACVLERPAVGGLLLGTGAGLAFLSKGLLGPGLVGVSAAALLAFRPWRRKAYVQGWLWAALAFAPWALVWPWLLWQRSPELFHEWLWVQNLGRFSGEHKIGGTPDHLHYVKALPWFALPAWPLAAWSVYSCRKTLRTDPAVQLPLAAFLAMFLVLSASSLARQIYALPMLLPLAALGAAGLRSAPAWLKVPLDRLAVWGGAAGATVLWLAWLAFFAGLPLVSTRLEAEAPGFAPHFSILPVAAALAISAAWPFAVRHGGLALRWAATSALLWGLLMTIWLPYLDYAKTYRGVIADMQRHRPAASGCVASRGLGEPQRALFHYFAGMTTVRESLPAARGCTLLLVQTSREKPAPEAAGWRLLWDGARPGERRERFWLFGR